MPSRTLPQNSLPDTVPLQISQGASPAIASSMLSVDLSPPETRTVQKAPLPTTRASRQAAISHNLTIRDKLQSAVRDLAYQTSWEIRTTINHPSHIGRRLSDAIAITVAAPGHMGDLCETLAHEGGEICSKLIQGCGKLAKTARRVARRANITISGVQQQYGGLGGGRLDEEFEEVFKEEAYGGLEEYANIMEWPEEEDDDNENLIKS
ncbi:hypothetical protein ABW20_dc0107772 [Dactylellina cionopaga]|nr:hypothetical protein ABW20_dc0107772 [Dactylellina cionopaga]